MANKVSEITDEDIINYLRLTELDYQEEQSIKTFLEIAINYIENYTGIARKKDGVEGESLDDYSDLVIVVYILCQDMYDNRTLYVDEKGINNTVKTILDMHTRNNI